jgi:hemoglobin-like flavoprotein
MCAANRADEPLPQDSRMSESDIAAFHDSFERCMEAGSRRFFDIFYDHFLRSSPEVSAKFQGTDFKRQKWVLRSSLYVMVSAVVTRSVDYSALTGIARRHARANRDIPPHLYVLWLDSLIFAARNCDPSFDAASEKTWREAMQRGIDYIASFY